MPKEVVMPRLSDTMSEGTVSKWLKQQGQAIVKGEVIAEIETDKATQELESYDSGVLSQILVAEGTTVPLGTPIAMIALPGEPGVAAPPALAQNGAAAAPASAPPAAQTPTTAQAAATASAPEATGERRPAASSQAVSAAPAPAAARPAAQPQPAAQAPAAAQAAPAADEERLRVSPIARRIAEEHGLDLHEIQSSGPGGRIVKEDVEAVVDGRTAASVAASATAAAPQAPATAVPLVAATLSTEAGEVFPLNRMQQTIARRLTQSMVEAPHFYVTTEIDMTEAAAFRKSLNASGEPGVSFNDLIIKAAALTLAKFPVVNASWDNGRLILRQSINVGFAAAMPETRGPGGLVVPVVTDADKRTLRQIALETKALIEKARAGRITERELGGATFSVSNMGMFDVDQFTAIISPPQSAILAVGSIVKKPVVKDDQIVIGDRMRVTLSIDHRVFYGATAAQFLQEVKRILEHPLAMV